MNETDNRTDRLVHADRDKIPYGFLDLRCQLRATENIRCHRPQDQGLESDPTVLVRKPSNVLPRQALGTASSGDNGQQTVSGIHQYPTGSVRLLSVARRAASQIARALPPSILVASWPVSEPRTALMKPRACATSMSFRVCLETIVSTC